MTTPKQDVPGAAQAEKEILVAGSLTKEQIEEAAQKRVQLITKEFTEGFGFLENYPKSVTVFGSSLVTSESPYYEKARSLCNKIAKAGYSVITGGGPGIMEAANRGAHEAQGKSLGITIKLPHEQTTNEYLTDTISLTYFFARKVILSFSAEAYLFFPGGYGTLDELFEILTLVQTKKITPVPIILVGSNFWGPLNDFLHGNILTHGMVEHEDIHIFKMLDDEEQILDIIQKAPVRNGVAYNHN